MKTFNSAALTVVLPMFAVGTELTPLKDTTLIVWVTPANLTQSAGSALTIDDEQSHFDGIVFGEITLREWMPGSETFRRTQRSQGNRPNSLPRSSS